MTFQNRAKTAEYERSVSGGFGLRSIGNRSLPISRLSVPSGSGMYFSVVEPEILNDPAIPISKGSSNKTEPRDARLRF